MSISVDESSPAWIKFKESEQKKYPNFGKVWFDDNGVISGTGKLRSWKWEARQYTRDRSRFIESLASVVSQVEKPPVTQAPTGKAAIPTGLNNKLAEIRQSNLTERGQVSSKTPSNSAMPRRTKRSQAWKKSGRSRRGRRMPNKALSSVKVPFKMVIPVDSAKSSAETGHWHNHLTLAELAGPALPLHEEFKCCSIKVRFIPQDITTGSGLYAACLLDQNGFGDPAKPTTTWFPRVADLPGARLCHITKGCMFTWRPTEPDSRNYRKYSESAYVVASFYIFGNETNVSIKGQLLITGLLRGRGEYYATNLAGRIKALSLLDDPEAGPSDLESLKSLSE